MWLQKGNKKDSYEDGNVLFPNCTNLNILVTIYIHIEFCRVVTIGGIWVKDICDLSVYCFLKLHVNLKWFHNEKV